MSFPSPTSVLKPITKYLQQSKQLERVDPTIAYYCRMYALQVGLKIQNKSKDDLAFIASQMAWLESNAANKCASKEDAREKCESFALQVFAVGDNEDRAGLASKKTALNFHAAYVLMDMCRQFSPTGDLPSDLEEKQRYAIVKAADINKCIKQGIKPKAGPLNEPSQEEQDREDEALLATLGGGSPATSSSAPPPSTAASAAAAKPHFSTAAAPFTGAAAAAGASHSLTASSAGYTPHAQASLFHHTALDGSPLPVTGVPVAASHPCGDLSPTPLPDTAASYLPPSNAPATGYPSMNASASAPPAQPTPSFNPHAAAAASASAHPAASGAHPAGGAAAHGGSSWKNSSGASGHISPFSKEGAAARNAAGGASSQQAFSKRDNKKMDATRDAERIIKHALSAVVFADIDTTVLKLKEALQILQPYSSK
jgi:hypothetical protein